MTWVYVGSIIAIVVVLFITFKTKGRNPKHDSSLPKEGKDELYEDYLSHGRPENHNRNKQI